MALAVDLDRTLLAPGEELRPIALESLRFARELGLRVILASGRGYGRLMPWARALGHVDAVVAENGAVVESPMGGRRIVRGRRAAAGARRRLANHGSISVEAGEVVLSVRASDGPAVAGIVAGLPVRLVRNVDRFMILPRGVSKAGGIREALRGLGMGRGRYAAIGDAANDLEMLRGASLSGAVGNAEPSVGKLVDYRCTASFAEGVAEFVRGPLAGLLDRAPSDRGVPRPTPRRRSDGGLTSTPTGAARGRAPGGGVVVGGGGRRAPPDVRRPPVPGGGPPGLPSHGGPDGGSGSGKLGRTVSAPRQAI